MPGRETNRPETSGIEDYAGLARPAKQTTDAPPSLFFQASSSILFQTGSELDGVR